MTLPNLGREFDRLVELLSADYDTVLRRFKAELARGRLSSLTQWVRQGWGRGALMAWATHARWLAIGSVPGRDVLEALGLQSEEWAATVETRALAVFGRGNSPLEPAAYLNLLAGITVRAGYHAGAEAAGAAGNARFKMWIRSYSGPGEHRHWHDALNGATIPAHQQFTLPGGPNAGARVDGPHDWDHLPDPADWANCGHALIYVPDATREDVLKGVRFSQSLLAARNPGSIVFTGNSKPVTFTNVELTPLNARFRNNKVGMNQPARQALSDHLGPSGASAAVARLAKWTRSYSDSNFQGNLRDAVEQVLDKGFARNEEEWLLLNYLITRPDRVAQVYLAHGLPVPTHFRVYRGVHEVPSTAVRQMVQTWLNNAVEDVQPWARSLSSWSLNPMQGEHFARWSGHGMVYQVDVPLHQTFADKLTDDGALVEDYFEEDEVIVMDLPWAPVVGSKRDVRILYNGIWFSFNDRRRLAALLGLPQEDT